MPTKSELETKILDLEHRLKSEISDRAMFHTELGKLALIHSFKPLLDFLNFTPEELIDLQEEI